MRREKYETFPEKVTWYIKGPIGAISATVLIILWGAEMWAYDSLLPRKKSSSLSISLPKDMDAWDIVKVAVPTVGSLFQREPLGQRSLVIEYTPPSWSIADFGFSLCFESRRTQDFCWKLVSSLLSSK